MAWTFKQARDRAVDQGSVELVQVAVVKAAIEVSGEEPDVENHSNRVSLARDVLRSPGAWARRMVWGVVTDSGVQSTVSDVTIYDAVLDQWDAYAGAS